MDKDFVIENNKLIKYIGNKKEITIPDFITDINNNAFANNKYITNIIISKNVKNIGKNAFSECKNLKTVIFQNEIEEIESGMFFNCVELQKVILPNNCKIIKDKVFCNCYSLIEINLENIRIIDNYAFNGCNLRKINIKEIDYIGKGAFKNTNIVEFKVEKIKLINEDAFCNCSHLKYFSADIIIEMSEKTFKDAKIENLNIKTNKFKNKNGENFIIEDNVIYTIDKKEMVYCAQDAKSSNYKIPDNVEIIRTDCFYGNRTIKTLTIGENVKEIQSKALYDTFLGNIIGNKKLEKIGQDAFSCGLINNINLSETLIEEINPIEIGVFDNDNTTQQLILPKKIKKINFDNYMSELNYKEIIIETNKVSEEIKKEIEQSGCKFICKGNKTLEELIEEGKTFYEASKAIKEQER